jgi:hypothetical protein
LFCYLFVVAGICASVVGLNARRRSLGKAAERDGAYALGGSSRSSPFLQIAAAPHPPPADRRGSIPRGGYSARGVVSGEEGVVRGESSSSTDHAGSAGTTSTTNISGLTGFATPTVHTNLTNLTNLTNCTVSPDQTDVSGHKHIAGLSGLNGLTALTTPNNATEGVAIYVQPWLLDVMWSDEDT